MIAATHAGLFDAALNYLWNETVGELRKRVVGYDLRYFYDIAIKSQNKRKDFKSEKDLPNMDDATLLFASRDIGILTDIGYARLDYIRHMRNHASAAHPNQNEITGLDLANWLEICIEHVITTPFDTITANVKKLLSNIKTAELDDSDISGTASFFSELPQERADILADGLFALYVDPEKTPIIADNVRRLWPRIWIHVTDDRRYSYGVKYGRFRANADSEQAKYARELIDLVDGTAYLPEEDRAIEIDEALDELLAAHEGWDNFYNEVAPARRLEKLIGDQGSIPKQVRRKYLGTLVKTYLGNAYGYSTAASEHYRKLLEALSPELASLALVAFSDFGISNALQYSSPQRQWTSLLNILDPKLVTDVSRDLITKIRSFSSTPDKLGTDQEINRMVERIRGGQSQ